MLTPDIEDILQKLAYIPALPPSPRRAPVVVTKQQRENKAEKERREKHARKASKNSRRKNRK